MKIGWGWPNKKWIKFLVPALASTKNLKIFVVLKAKNCLKFQVFGQKSIT